MEPKMKIEHVLAVVPVADVDAAREWYTRLFGRGPDNNPMESLVEWRLADTGWLQVTVDPDRAGKGLMNLAVADLAAQASEVAGRGIATGEIQPVNKAVAVCPITDPDGNVITLIGNFRVTY